MLRRFLASAGSMSVKAVGYVLAFVFTWGIGFRLAYDHYRGDWLSFWIIFLAWMALSMAIIIWLGDWLFGRQPDPEGDAEKKAFDARVEAILSDQSLDVEETVTALEALSPPKERVVSRWSKFWGRVQASRAR